MISAQTWDVAIVGGGLSGSFAAALLGTAGYSVAVIDPNASYPDEFRCEKFGAGHLKSVERTHLKDKLLAIASPNERPLIARRGRVVERSGLTEYGLKYADLVNVFRNSIPETVERRVAKVTNVETSDDVQTVTLSDKTTLRARLVIMANGLNQGLREQLGMFRRDLSPCHSITIGFDIEAKDAKSFEFQGMTYFGEDPIHRVGYITIFPIGERRRVNLFVYRDLNDPWLRKLRDNPREAIAEVLPNLECALGPYSVVSPVKIRPIDLYKTEGVLMPGIALTGDACGTACPATGTGAMKAFVDVERLCNVYVPRWLASPRMGIDKIRQYYADPEKVASDARTLDLAFRNKNIAVKDGVTWKFRRLARYALSVSRQAWRDATHMHSPLIPVPGARRPRHASPLEV